MYTYFGVLVSERQSKLQGRFLNFSSYVYHKWTNNKFLVNIASYINFWKLFFSFPVIRRIRNKPQRVIILTRPTDSHLVKRSTKLNLTKLFTALILKENKRMWLQSIQSCFCEMVTRSTCVVHDAYPQTLRYHSWNVDVLEGLRSRNTCCFVNGIIVWIFVESYLMSPLCTVRARKFFHIRKVVKIDFVFYYRS